MGRKLCAFPYFGGKWKQLKDILPLLPDCHHYVEPFCGSAAVLINRRPAPVETVNDINEDLVTFFRVLREQPDALVEALRLTPYARAELWESYAEILDDLPPVERARRFFVRTLQTRAGLGGGGRYRNSWSYGVTRSSVSRWLSHVESLHKLAKRLRRVQIECRDALEVIAAYDAPGTLFFIDPPYAFDCREEKSRNVYAVEFSDECHRKLADLLGRVVGKVALTTYESPLMRALYPEDRWQWIECGRNVVHASSNRIKPRKSEFLVTNYPPPQRLLA